MSEGGREGRDIGYIAHSSQYTLHMKVTVHESNSVSTRSSSTQTHSLKHVVI